MVLETSSGGVLETSGWSWKTSGVVVSHLGVVVNCSHRVLFPPSTVLNEYSFRRVVVDLAELVIDLAKLVVDLASFWLVLRLASACPHVPE